jgi:hypothetical protein
MAHGIQPRPRLRLMRDAEVMSMPHPVRNRPSRTTPPARRSPAEQPMKDEGNVSVTTPADGGDKRVPPADGTN